MIMLMITINRMLNRLFDQQTNYTCLVQQHYVIFWWSPWLCWWLQWMLNRWWPTLTTALCWLLPWFCWWLQWSCWWLPWLPWLCWWLPWLCWWLQWKQNQHLFGAASRSRLIAAAFSRLQYFCLNFNFNILISISISIFLSQFQFFLHCTIG